jgi:hypothetical protein
MKKFLGVVGVILLAAVIGFSGFIWWKLQPHPDPQPLPPELIALDTPEGSAMLEGAEDRADYGALSQSYVSQELISYCGVASSVTVLNALGQDTSQSDFFTPEASLVRPRRQVMFGGMSLLDLAGLLAAHGAIAEVHFADTVSLDDFRVAVQRNLADPDDYLLVNYQRGVLGQAAVGHISPLAAYDADTDRVLIMDTASYKYPPTWVPLAKLYEAMNTTDSSSGRARGYVEVTQASPGTG